MKDFVRLFIELDETNKTNQKVASMAAYFQNTSPRDAAWGLFFLTGRRPKRPVNVTKLWTWANDLSALPGWLFSECYDAVGDLAETIATILPDTAEVGSADTVCFHEWIEQRLLPMQGMEDEEQREIVERSWRELDRNGRFVWNKLITGGFRVGVSQDLVIRALSHASGVPVVAVAHRLMGEWEPTAKFFEQLMCPEDGESNMSRPYPFCLAHSLAGAPDVLGPVVKWAAEWKWDGIRCQLVKRGGQTFLWSRGEDLISNRFPEVFASGELVPNGTVIDGELLGWQGDKPLPFAELQKRIGRKTVGKKLLEDVPVSLIAFDLLEWESKDIRPTPYSERRRTLENLLARWVSSSIRISPQVSACSWEDLAIERQQARGLNVEGLMLKRKDSAYGVGRKKGVWWKWKIEPFTVDAVLLYAARGNGIRASLYTDYTFGIWKEGELVPFAKAYSGLDDAEIRQVDAFVRRSTVEKFGPVRTVRPELVFELAFEGIQLSKRHKSGIAVRFPRIARWRHDKKPEDADSIETVRQLLRET